MIIGFDPGNTGAIAVLTDEKEFVAVHDMPVMANGKKNQVNAAEVARIINEYASNQKCFVVIEKVGAMPGQGVTSMFNFGMGFGVIQGVVAARELPFVLVTPQKWKKRSHSNRQRKRQC